MERQLRHRYDVRRRSEAGDTLIEILLAVVIIGLTSVAVLAGLATGLTASGQHKNLATIDTVLRSYAETLTYDIELQPTTPWFTDCAATTPTSYSGNPLPPPLAGYSVGVVVPPGQAGLTVAVAYWNSGGGFDSTCGINDHTGIQQLKIIAVAPNGTNQSLSVIVRNP